MITPEAKPRWYRHMPTGEARSAREGLLRLADGQWLIGFGRQNGTFACVDAASGSPRWDLPLQASTSDVLTCDVDSDGAQEFVFATSHGELIAVGDGGTAPRVLWRLPLEASGCAQITGFNSDYSMDPGLGYPIAADLDGDGAVEIVLCTVDGIIHVYGANRSAGTSVESGRMK